MGGTKIAFVAEYGSAGNQIALTVFQASDPYAGDSTASEGHGIALDDSGGVYVVGTATFPGGGDTDAFLVKFDATNQLLPVAGYGGSIGGPNFDSGDGVAVNALHEATITGSFQPSPTETDLFAAKFTSQGADTFFANAYVFPNALGSARNCAAFYWCDHRRFRHRFSEACAIDVKYPGEKHRGLAVSKPERRQTERIFCGRSTG